MLSYDTHYKVVSYLMLCIYQNHYNNNRFYHHLPCPDKKWDEWVNNKFREKFFFYNINNFSL